MLAKRLDQPRLAPHALPVVCRMIRRGVFDHAVRERAAKLLADAEPARTVPLRIVPGGGGRDYQVRRVRDEAILAIIPDGPGAAEAARDVAEFLKASPWADSP